MGTREGSGVNGKYLLIEVPNYNDAESEAEAMGSCLRLGAVKDPADPRGGAARAPGLDLGLGARLAARGW